MITVIRDIVIIGFALAAIVVLLYSWIDGIVSKRKRNKKKEIKEEANKLQVRPKLTFQYYQPHPEGMVIGDCSTRALTKALDVDWETAFNLQIEMALGCHAHTSSAEVCDKLLISQGFVRKEFKKPSKITEIYLTEPAVIENDNHCVYTDGTFYYDLNVMDTTLYHHYWVYVGEDNG